MWPRGWSSHPGSAEGRRRRFNEWWESGIVLGIGGLQWCSWPSLARRQRSNVVLRKRNRWKHEEIRNSYRFDLKYKQYWEPRSEWSEARWLRQLIVVGGTLNVGWGSGSSWELKGHFCFMPNSPNLGGTTTKTLWARRALNMGFENHAERIEHHYSCVVS